MFAAACGPFSMCYTRTRCWTRSISCGLRSLLDVLHSWHLRLAVPLCASPEKLRLAVAVPSRCATLVRVHEHARADKLRLAVPSRCATLLLDLSKQTLRLAVPSRCATLR